MPDNSQHNSAFNAAATSKVHHALFEDIQRFNPEKLGHLQRGGIRSGVGRTPVQAQQMLNKIPPSQRAGVDGQSAAANVKRYLSDKDASHIVPHSKGGSGHPNNLRWEPKAANRARSDRTMTRQEQLKLDAKAHAENLTGAVKAGVQAAAKGAVIGAVTTAPFSMLRNALRVIRGELSTQEAALESIKDTAIGGGVGAATAFTVTAVATACPPVAIALTAVSPALLAVGGAGMVYEFFQILDAHKREVKEYYASLTRQELMRLQEMEENLSYAHEKNLEFLIMTQALNEEIDAQEVKPGIQGALEGYLHSVAAAKRLGLTSNDSKLISGSQLPLLPHSS